MSVGHLIAGAVLPSIERRVAMAAMDAAKRRAMGLPATTGVRIPLVAPQGLWQRIEQDVTTVKNMKPGWRKSMNEFFMKEGPTAIAYIPSEEGMALGQTLGKLTRGASPAFKEDLAAMTGMNPATRDLALKKYEPILDKATSLMNRLPMGHLTPQKAEAYLDKAHGLLDKADVARGYLGEHGMPLALTGAAAGVGAFALNKQAAKKPPMMVGEKKPEPPRPLDRKYKSPYRKLINSAIKANTTGGKVDVLLTYTKKDGSKAMRMVRPVTTKKDLIVVRDHMRDGEYRSFKLDRIHTMEKAAAFKSKAQRRFFYAAEARGDLPEGTAARWEDETTDKNLPERVHKKEAAMHPAFREGFEKSAADVKVVQDFIGKALGKNRQTANVIAKANTNQVNVINPGPTPKPTPTVKPPKPPAPVDAPKPPTSAGNYWEQQGVPKQMGGVRVPRPKEFSFSGTGR